MFIYVLYEISMCVYFFFFFKQKTAYEMRISDWSSDVCSSDLGDTGGAIARRKRRHLHLIAAGRGGNGGLGRRRRRLGGGGLCCGRLERRRRTFGGGGRRRLGRGGFGCALHRRGDRRRGLSGVEHRPQAREQHRRGSEEHTDELQSLMRN